VKIAKHGKPFVGGEFLKECLQCVDIICPAKKQVISNISLSKYIIARQIEDLSENIFSILKPKCLNFVFCSAAMDESTHATGNAQLAILIHGVN
jgi:hypothetical protein